LSSADLSSEIIGIISLVSVFCKRLGEGEIAESDL